MLRCCHSSDFPDACSARHQVLACFKFSGEATAEAVEHAKNQLLEALREGLHRLVCLMMMTMMMLIIIVMCAAISSICLHPPTSTHDTSITSMSCTACTLPASASDGYRLYLSCQYDYKLHCCVRLFDTVEHLHIHPATPNSAMTAATFAGYYCCSDGIGRRSNVNMKGEYQIAQFCSVAEATLPRSTDAQDSIKTMELRVPIKLTLG